MRIMPALVLLLLAGCTCRVITARDYLVLRIVDGDTFKVHYDGEQTSVRFIGMDSPELTEPGGADATAAIERLVGGRVVRLDFAGERKRDNFVRLLFRVYVDGVDVGQALGLWRLLGLDPLLTDLMPAGSNRSDGGGNKAIEGQNSVRGSKLSV